VGVFGKSDKQSKQSNGTTIIAQGTTIKGGLDVQGSIFIDGRFEGIVVASENVTIGKTGEVLGEIRTKNLTISGFIDGLFDVENMNILSTGRVIGRIQYDELTIEPNGIFEGEGKKKNSTLSSQYNSLEINQTYQIES
jgi:cytoskeletal protein CcmA (bactofilin family)